MKKIMSYRTWLPSHYWMSNEWDNSNASKKISGAYVCFHWGSNPGSPIYWTHSDIHQCILLIILDSLTHHSGKTRNLGDQGTYCICNVIKRASEVGQRGKVSKYCDSTWGDSPVMLIHFLADWRHLNLPALPKSASIIHCEISKHDFSCQGITVIFWVIFLHLEVQSQSLCFDFAKRIWIPKKGIYILM